MKLIAVLALIVAPNCQGLEPGRTLSPAHLAYIRAERFARIRHLRDLPSDVRPLVEEVPPGRLVVAGCSETHCLVEYESSGDRHIFELEIVGLSDEGASVEWRGLLTRRAHDLPSLKRLATGR